MDDLKLLRERYVTMMAKPEELALRIRLMRAEALVSILRKRLAAAGIPH